VLWNVLMLATRWWRLHELKCCIVENRSKPSAAQESISHITQRHTLQPASLRSLPYNNTRIVGMIREAHKSRKCNTITPGSFYRPRPTALQDVKMNIDSSSVKHRNRKHLQNHDEKSIHCSMYDKFITTAQRELGNV